MVSAVLHLLAALHVCLAVCLLGLLGGAAACYLRGGDRIGECMHNRALALELGCIQRVACPPNSESRLPS